MKTKKQILRFLEKINFVYSYEGEKEIVYNMDLKKLKMFCKVVVGIDL